LGTTFSLIFRFLSSFQKTVRTIVKGDSELIGGTLDVQYFFMWGIFSPYVVAAVGGMNTSYKMQSSILGTTANYEKNTTSFIFETGIGSTYNVTDYMALRGDVRYRLNTLPRSVGSDNTNIFSDLTVNFGIVVPFN
jgi:OOP family OmpA-OmpF porin